MANHRHWSSSSDVTPVPAAPVTETAAVVQPAPTTPQFVWVATYQQDRDEDPIVKVFPTESDADDWKIKFAMDEGSGPREADEDDEDDEDESEEAYADRFFEDATFFEIRRMEVKPYRG